jgi:hypothetical protein
MRRTTILADEHLLIEAKHLATREVKTFTALLQDALRDYVERHRPKRRVSFAGIGRSGESRTSEQMDAELIAGLDRHEGWSPPRGSSRATSGRTPEDST